MNSKLRTAIYKRNMAHNAYEKYVHNYSKQNRREMNNPYLIMLPGIVPK